MSNKNKESILEMVKIENGENYLFNDNRTHIGELLSLDPVEDLHCHYSLSTEGSSLIRTLKGNFVGHYSVESMRKIKDSLFHFPKANEIPSLTIVYSLKLETLFPASIIEKFKLHETSKLSYSQKTPVYFDKSTYDFVVFMDERFLVDIKSSEIVKDENNIKVYKNKKRTCEYLAITGKSMNELKDNLMLDDSPFDILKKRYKTHFIDREKAKRVIVLRFEHENESEMKTFSSNQFTVLNSKKNVFNLMMRQKMDLEIFQAALINDLFYLMDEDGQIDSSAIIHFNEKESMPENHNVDNNDAGFIYKKGGKAYLIIDYTEEDWEFIVNLKNKLNDVCKDLEKFFLSTKTELGKSDKSFYEGNLISSNVKMLSNRN